MREQQLRDAELGDAFLAAERLDLLLVQLQRRHVPQHVGVEVGVEDERARSRRADERLAVEREPPVAGEEREHVGREVGAGQPADLHPVGAADRARIVERPRRAGSPIDISRSSPS